MRTSRVTTKQCVEAIHNSGGFITPAAKQLNISQAALSKRIKKSKALQQVLAETKEQYLDLAETQLIKAVRDREAWAISFYLKLNQILYFTRIKKLRSAKIRSAL